MKKITTILFLKMCLLVYPAYPQNYTLEKLVRTPIVCNDYPGDFHRLCFDSASWYISNFLQYENLKDEARVHGIGGFIPGPLRTNGYVHPAFKFYPCYDDDFFIFKDDVFMAYEYDERVNPLNPNCALVSQNEYVQISNERFYYKEKGTSPEEVQIFLLNLRQQVNTRRDSIHRDMVMQLNRRFFEVYTALGNPISAEHYQCGAVHEDNIEALLSQTYTVNGMQERVAGFRYFFGFDRTRTHSKFRLILIAVKADGTNFIVDDANNEAIILERHWPPD